MRPRETFVPFMIAGLVLTLAILAAFQLYVLREPARIHAAEAADSAAAVAAGRTLFQDNCMPCHGSDGQGGVGPALNSKGLLTTTSDTTFFGIIRTGVPGSVMPAWGQTYGGPLTDEDVGNLVAFLRSWEPNAPEVTPEVSQPSASRGAAIFVQTCAICHGQNGVGTDRAPALNDPVKLHQFDDAWYHETIAQGRPAKGMPTWGTVLSPQQLDDVVALIAAWRDGETVNPPIPVLDHLLSAMFALQRSDPQDASYHLELARVQAAGDTAAKVQSLTGLIQQGDLDMAKTQLQDLIDTLQARLQQGQDLFTTNCAPCHGTQGEGKVGPNLHGNSFVQSLDDGALQAFILAGRPGTAMAGFQGRLTDPQLAPIVALLRSWQP
jgi:mono/diheme cytochrome c family protein